MARHIFECIDAHTCGNPVRLVKTNRPELNGDTMMDRRLHFLEEYDWIRRGLMFEPRGHDMMSGGFLYPSNDPDCDVGFLYIETSGCLPMCGHGTIGLVTIAIEEGLVTPATPGKLMLDTPAGKIAVEYEQEGGRVSSVKLTNIASFLAEENLTVQCPDLGELIVDVSYGGNFYAIVDPQKNFAGLQDYTASDLIRWSPEIRKRMNERYEFHHPEDKNIQGLTHVLWTGYVLDPTSHGRNAVFYGEKAIDRSPCGTGTSARMAQLFAQNKLAVGDEYIHESIIGSRFVGKVESEALVGGKQGIIPSIKGWARITGYNNIILDDEDPFVGGFTVK
jgi:4-hydroxyproline epimerase